MLRRLATLLIPAMFVGATPAQAGGIGPYFMGGFHTDTVYYYSNRVGGGAGPVIPDIGSFERYDQTQIIGNAGAGLELVLGDRDDLIQGVFRGFWMMDTPQTNPNTDGRVTDEALVSVYRDTPRHNGVGTVGILWGLGRFGQGQKLKISLAAHVGAGFLSAENQQFFLAQAGTNIAYLLGRGAELYVDVNYGFRVRKQISHGMIGAAGVRVLFD